MILYSHKYYLLIDDQVYAESINPTGIVALYGMLSSMWLNVRLIKPTTSSN